VVGQVALKSRAILPACPDRLGKTSRCGAATEPGFCSSNFAQLPLVWTVSSKTGGFVKNLLRKREIRGFGIVLTNAAPSNPTSHPRLRKMPALFVERSLQDGKSDLGWRLSSPQYRAWGNIIRLSPARQLVYRRTCLEIGPRILPLNPQLPRRCQPMFSSTFHVPVL